jgi:hypothetical protein
MTQKCFLSSSKQAHCLKNYCEERDMDQFLKPAKLSLSLFKPLSDCNVFTQFKCEASASSSASSKLPVTWLEILIHVPSPQIKSGLGVGEGLYSAGVTAWADVF